MPHKNDIKFVKTERCNDRTASSYGVGAGGEGRVSRGEEKKTHEYAAAGSATAGRGTDARVVNEIETERATPRCRGRS